MRTWISLLVFFSAITGTAAAPAGRPNIIFILADDLGYGELGCYGQEKIRTPNLDRLAEQGTRFTRHYSGNAVCAPSRCVLMTGKHPGHAYIRDNGEVEPEGQMPIPANELTIAEVLKARGYATGAFGKWGLGYPGSEGDPLKQGFDRFYGYNCQRHAHSYYPSYLWDNDKRVELRNDPPVPGHAGLPDDADPNDPRSYERFKGKDYAPDRIHEEAVKFIRANKDRPFFLYYASTIPHLALHVPDERLKPYLELGWEDPPFTRQGRGYTPHFTPRAAYAAMISSLDAYAGELLALLSELGLSENTVVVFSSDNGTSQNPDVYARFFRSAGGLRGMKGSLYEGGVRVPLIVRWPGKVKAGAVSNEVSGFEDWLPTFAELAGATLPAETAMDGMSLIPALLGQPREERAVLYREFPASGGQQAVWFGQWKAIRTNMLRRGNTELPAIQLYDLEADPSESRDLAAQHPDLVERARKLMASQHTPSKPFPFRGID